MTVGDAPHSINLFNSKFSERRPSIWSSNKTKSNIFQHCYAHFLTFSLSLYRLPFLNQNSLSSLKRVLKISTINTMLSMYSASKMKSDRKPPLPKSPVRLRPRRVLRPSNSCSLQTPPGSLAKFKKPTQDIQESELRPEYRTISCELRNLTKMVQEEFGKTNSENSAFACSPTVNSSSLFERGRFYDEYSARRNERLKRKKGIMEGDNKPLVYHLGVNVESAKKSGFKSGSKKLESLRKSVSAAYAAQPCETPRYMLRSMTKANKKPPLPSNFEKSLIGVDKKNRASRVRGI